jgi:Cdc6-like AAA superfamily ATPase
VSEDALATAAAVPQVFDPTPPPDTLPACIAPFETLIPGCRLESDLRHSLSHYGRIGLTGPSGCGKSSATRHALGHERIAMILVNVVTENADVLSSVRDFLQLLVSQLLSRAQTADKLPNSTRQALLAAAQPSVPLDRRQITTRAQFQGAYWLLRGGVAREVVRQIGGGQAPTATADLRQAASEALAVVAGHELVPVIVADDADQLLAAVEEQSVDRLIAGFFGEVLRELSENLDCGLLVAVKDGYYEMARFCEATDGILTRVNVPRVTRAEELAKIVEQRAAFLPGPVSASDLIHEQALAALAELHCGTHRHSIRSTLVVLRAALTLAASDGSQLVSAAHVRAAAAG